MQVLRKEITFEELQQYGFCLFTALAHLHKQVMLLPYSHLFLILLILQWSIFFWTAVLQGIVHRDVKPGNFLFSRKQRLGYLVDFNLAMVCPVHHNATFLKFACVIAISRFPSIWKPESVHSNCKFSQRLVWLLLQFNLLLNSVFGLVFSFLQGGVFIFFMLLIIAGFWSDLKSLIMLLS